MAAYIGIQIELPNRPLTNFYLERAYIKEIRLTLGDRHLFALNDSLLHQYLLEE